MVVSKGETFGRAPQSSKHFCLTKNQDGRTELPVDVPSAGDPIKGSPEGRHKAALLLDKDMKKARRFSLSACFLF